MEPRIQYAQTADGVSIAYTTWETGFPRNPRAAYSYTFSPATSASGASASTSRPRRSIPSSR